MRILAVGLPLVLALALGCSGQGNGTVFPPAEPAPSIGATDTGPASVYVLAGQSNAEGIGNVADLLPGQSAPPTGDWIYLAPGDDGQAAWLGIWTPLVAGDGGDSAQVGPELGFARSMPGPVRVIKYAVGGTSMDTFWRSPGAGGAFPGYVGLLQAVQTGLASAQTPAGAHIAGLLWLQGEGDTCNAEAAANYATRLAAFVTDFRAAVGEPALPVVVAQIHALPAWPYAGAVQSAEAGLPGVLPNVGTFATQDLPTFSGTNPHFDGPAQYTIGQRFGAAIQALVPD